MLIIFGRRAFGRIDAHGGEYAQTTFAHVYFMPLVPLESHWVTTNQGGETYGIEIKMSGKSIAATYLRAWGPIAALIAFGSVGGWLGLAAAAPFVAAIAWAWSWRSLRGEGALRRSDFNLLAFGTRCEPTRMSREHRDHFKANLDARWRDLGVQRPPDDTAKFGARTAEEAVAAYGLLRLAAIEHRDAAARAAAERILDGTHDVAAAADSPYRDDAHRAVPATNEVLAHVAVAAANAARPTAPRVPWWRFTNAKGLVAGLFALVAIGGILEEGPSLLGVRSVKGAELASAPTNRFVEVRCHAIEEIGELANDKRAYACSIGELILPVIGTLPATAPGTAITGKLVDLDDNDVQWPAEIRRSPLVPGVYCKLESPATSRALAIGCIFVLAAIVAFGVVNLLARRRREA